jgi:rsbT co-antagonist protein RsbR
MTANASKLPEIFSKHEAEILAQWVEAQAQALGRRPDLISQKDLHEESREFLHLVTQALQGGGVDITAPPWAPVRERLHALSRSRALQGFSPVETATFVFSLKQPVFTLIRATTRDAERLAEETWATTLLLDGLGLHTMEVYQRGREEVIARQQQDMLELSTPVVQLWRDILALPLIGTLDSNRTQVVMESLLGKIVETGASTAIIDITGVPTVDTLVAQHLLKTVAAARLMGADCIVSGIRPQIAQTIVHLGVALGDVVTKATLADAFAVALARHGLTVGPRPKSV